MSRLLQDALKASLESADDQNLSDDGLQAEEIAASSAEGTIQEWVEDCQEARKDISALNDIATKAESAAESGETNTISAESMFMAIEALSGRYGLSVDRTSMESGFGTGDIHREIAVIARANADRLKEALHPSMEGMPFKYLFNEVAALDKYGKDLQEVGLELKRNAPFFKDQQVGMNHFGVFQFLTLNNKPVSNVVEALSHNNKVIEELFKIGNELRVEVTKQMVSMTTAKLESDEDAEALITVLNKSDHLSQNLKKIDKEYLLGNRQLDVFESAEIKHDDKKQPCWSVSLDKTNAKPTNKMSWWFKLPATLGAYYGVSQAAWFAFGATNGAAIPAFGLGVYAGAKTAGALNKAISGIKTVGHADLSEMERVVADTEKLVQEAQKYRKDITSGYNMSENLNKKITERLKAFGGSSALRTRLRDTMDVIHANSEAEWSCFEVAVEQTVYTLKNVISIVEKLNKTAGMGK